MSKMRYLKTHFQNRQALGAIRHSASYPSILVTCEVAWFVQIVIFQMTNSDENELLKNQLW